MASIDQKDLGRVKKLYSQGLSAREIAETLDVGIDAVYYFMKRNHIVRRDPSQSNHMRFLRKPKSFRVPSQLSKEEEALKRSAIMLYWAEGAKRGKVVDFANSDPEMCKIFMKFLREICRVDESRLRGYIYCHANKDPQQLISYWSDLMKLSKAQFTKPYIRQSFSSKRSERMKNGLLHIRYADKKLLHQINEWIDEEASHLGR